jgi:hypothetical protein
LPRQHDRRPEYRDRRRDEDTGPSVAGFGSDVPAFMTLRRRNAAPVREEGDSEA